MKKILLFLFLVLHVCIFAQNDLTKVKKFGKNKGNLKMYTYIPKKLNTSQKTPLVFVLHGCTQCASQISKQTGWNKLADSLNFIVVYPEQRLINNVAKCYNFFLSFDAKKDKGEVASIKQMVDYCFTNYNIDSSMVFITGMSAGGGMSNAMLNAYPTLFNAGALLAAPSILFNRNSEVSAPENQPRVAILQGEKDKIVTPKNADKILNHWIKRHQLETSNVEVKENYLGNPLLNAQFYNNNVRTKIISLRAEKIAHKLLITPGEEINKGGKMDFHTRDIGFHSTYWIAEFFGLVSN